MEQRQGIGHILAFLTIVIWGTTFISTKILLADMQPVEILFYRFVMGYGALFLIYPHLLKATDRRQELLFAAAGLCGICLYYLLENIALTYTMASNVGVLVSVSPFFTALLSHWFGKEEEKFNRDFLIGFLVAMVGIVLISFNGAKLQLNPLGDILAVLAAFVWACYAVLTKKISQLGYPVVLATRHTFFYGILFMIPALFIFGFRWDFTWATSLVGVGNLLYLGLGASALCFVTWNMAVNSLGAVKTSVYIYLIPVITVITSVIVLRETITPLAVIGMVLILLGLFLSERSALLPRKNTDCQ
ncbi:MAG: DMT family transporter [Peptococcaceae bacterium]|nr:DMT family transporter [Peptococcaceae bacterium]